MKLIKIEENLIKSYIGSQWLERRGYAVSKATDQLLESLTLGGGLKRRGLKKKQQQKIHNQLPIY